MPEVPVLSEIHNNDRHPIYIDVGFIRSHDFDEYLGNNRDPCVSTSGLEVTVTVPLLASAPNGPPLYALALKNFYEKSMNTLKNCRNTKDLLKTSMVNHEFSTE